MNPMRATLDRGNSAIRCMWTGKGRRRLCFHHTGTSLSTTRRALSRVESCASPFRYAQRPGCPSIVTLWLLLQNKRDLRSGLITRAVDLSCTPDLPGSQCLTGSARTAIEYRSEATPAMPSGSAFEPCEHVAGVLLRHLNRCLRVTCVIRSLPRNSMLLADMLFWNPPLGGLDAVAEQRIPVQLLSARRRTLTSSTPKLAVD